MTNAQVTKAEQIAWEQFNKHNGERKMVSTPKLPLIEQCIEDAVHIGIQMALYGDVKIRNGEVIVRNVETTQQDGSVSLDV